MSKARTTADLVNQPLATQSFANAKVADAIVDGTTTIAPSENAVFDALALKSDKLAAAYSFGANITSGTANKTDQILKPISEQTYSGTDAWDGTPPSGSSTKTYQWIDIGGLVIGRFNIKYATPGINNQIVTLTKPSDMPDPLVPSGFTGSNAALYIAKGGMTSSITPTTTTLIQRGFIKINSSNNGYVFGLYSAGSGVTAAAVFLTVIYFA